MLKSGMKHEYVFLAFSHPRASTLKTFLIKKNSDHHETFPSVHRIPIKLLVTSAKTIGSDGSKWFALCKELLSMKCKFTPLTIYNRKVFFLQNGSRAQLEIEWRRDKKHQTDQTSIYCLGLIKASWRIFGGVKAAIKITLHRLKPRQV